MFARRLFCVASLLTLAMAVLAFDGRSCRAQAQGAANLSGTWELVEINGSKKKHQPPGKFPRMILVIAQEGPEIRITKKRTRQGKETVQNFSYYTDGRGENNTGRLELWGDDQRGFESVSGWEKDRLVTKYDNRVTLQTGSNVTSAGYSAVNSALRRSDEWRLGRDGKTLAMTTTNVQMHSPTITGGLSDPTLETGPARDNQASYGQFGKSKLVFRKI